jgi:hypothetical protein
VSALRLGLSAKVEGRSGRRRPCLRRHTGVMEPSAPRPNVHGGATGDRRTYFRGVVAVLGLFLVPTVFKAVSVPLADLVEITFVLMLIGLIWSRGPEVGFDRRAGLLIGVPLIGVFVLFPAVWRWATRRRWSLDEPLEPAWSERGWRIGQGIGTVGLTALVVAALVQVALHL